MKLWSVDRADEPERTLLRVAIAIYEVGALIVAAIEDQQR